MTQSIILIFSILFSSGADQTVLFEDEFKSVYANIQEISQECDSNEVPMTREATKEAMNYPVDFNKYSYIRIFSFNRTVQTNLNETPQRRNACFISFQKKIITLKKLRI